MRRNGDWNSKEKGNDVQFGNERKWRVESRQHGWLKERASEYFASPSGPWHPLTAKILLSAPAPYTYIHLTSTNCLSYTYICKKHLAKYCALKNGLIESFYGFSLILNKCLSTPACVFFYYFLWYLSFSTICPFDGYLKNIKVYRPHKYKILTIYKHYDLPLFPGPFQWDSLQFAVSLECCKVLKTSWGSCFLYPLISKSR